MSYDFNVYFRRAAFPALPALRERLRPRLEITDDVDFLTDTGWVNVILDGSPTGFEVYSSPIDEDRRAGYRARLARNGSPPDQHLGMLESCDFDLNVNCKRNELTAARLVMTAIATMTNGWLSDPQEASTVQLGSSGSRA